jgi:iron complex transport system ATP-binding protein
MERVILLRAGRILADGAKQTVLTETNLATLFNVAVRLHRHDGFFHAY